MMSVMRRQVATVTVDTHPCSDALGCIAGLIIVGVANGLSILFLGILGTGSDRTGAMRPASYYCASRVLSCRFR